jgi:hypothetical protein
MFEDGKRVLKRSSRMLPKTIILAVPPAGHANDFASDLPIDRRAQEQDRRRNVLLSIDGHLQHSPQDRCDRI